MAGVSRKYEVSENKKICRSIARDKPKASKATKSKYRCCPKSCDLLTSLKDSGGANDFKCKCGCSSDEVAEVIRKIPPPPPNIVKVNPYDPTYKKLKEIKSKNKNRPCSPQKCFCYCAKITRDAGMIKQVDDKKKVNSDQPRNKGSVERPQFVINCLENAGLKFKRRDNCDVTNPTQPVSKVQVSSTAHIICAHANGCQCLQNAENVSCGNAKETS